MPGYVLVVRWAARNKTDALSPALMESIVWGERQSIKMQLKIEILLLKEKRDSDSVRKSQQGMFASS